MAEQDAAAVMDGAVATVAVASVQSTLMSGSGPSKRTRKSYTREEKLKVVTFYHENSENLYRTCKRFQLNNRTVKRWITNEKAIKESKKGRKRIMFERRAEHPGMEQKLYKEYKELRKKGLKVKRWWFMLRAKAILEDLKADAQFAFSDDWFTKFKKRRLRRGTNTCQKEPDDKRKMIQQFHRSIRQKAQLGTQVGPLGKWTHSQVANVDQTLLPFTFTDGSTYADTGDKTIWIRGGAAGLDKRQCTAQLTVFADGEPRVNPLLIFKGTGMRIPLAERARSVSVYRSILSLHCNNL